MRKNITENKYRHGGFATAFFMGIVVASVIGFLSVSLQKKANAQLLPIGLYGLQIVWNTVQTNNSPMELIMTCPSGKVAIGGGVDNEGLPGSSIEASRPYGSTLVGPSGSATATTGWYIRINPGRNTPMISSYAVCVSQGT